MEVEFPHPSGPDIELRLSSKESEEGDKRIDTSSEIVKVSFNSPEAGSEEHRSGSRGPSPSNDSPDPPLHYSPQGRVSTREGNNDDMAESCNGTLLCLALVAASIGALLVVILVPLSFSDLEYYEVSRYVLKHSIFLMT